MWVISVQIIQIRTRVRLLLRMNPIMSRNMIRSRITLITLIFNQQTLEFGDGQTTTRSQ